MIFEYATLKLIWWALIIVLLIGFTISCGMDLGVAVLLMVIGKTDADRRVIINAIGPTWDGNQVWFLVSAGAIFAGWPLLYAAVFSSLYFAFFLVLLMLILRPPGIDYRSKLPSKHWRQFWDICLFLSGVTPAFFFGLAFANIILGISFYYDDSLRPIITQSFSSLFRPITVLAGIASLSMLTVQGALFLQLKLDEKFSAYTKNIATYTGCIFILSFICTGLYVAFEANGFKLQDIADINSVLSPVKKIVLIEPKLWSYNYRYRCSNLVAVPIAVIASSCLALWASRYDKPGLAIFLNSFSLASVIVTIGITMFPFILPSSAMPSHSLTIWDACSSKLTLQWLFWIILIFLPIVLLYTTWVYRVMRGKVTEKISLHHPEAY